MSYPEIIRDGDTVVISGGGLNKCLVVKKSTQTKLGRCGNVFISSIIGQRYGDVFAFDDKKRTLIPTLDTPELDRSEIQADQVVAEGKDNRELFDTHGANQTLTEEEVNAIKVAEGVENVVKSLVENSSSFASKTAFAQEKYVRKKKGKYAVKFKVERVNPDNLCETILPTLLIEMEEVEDGKKRLPIRVDTMGLILHHGNVSGDMRVLCHDRTNGMLPASILYRLGPKGLLFAVYDRTSMPATAFCRAMHIPDWKERWKAVPATPAFFTEEGCLAAEATPLTEDDIATTRTRWSDRKAKSGGVNSTATSAGADNNNNTNNEEDGAGGGDRAGAGAPSQWVRATECRRALISEPADSLIIAGFEDEVVPVVKKLFPFLALSGNLVVYCPFIEPLERIYALIRDEAVCISISDTWYRHQQVLPGRTHPQVNMSTGGGFLLTAIKVESGTGVTIGGNSSASASADTAAPTDTSCAAAPVVGEKREREEDTAEPARTE